MLHDQTIREWLRNSYVSEEEANFLFRYFMEGTFAVVEDWYRSDFAMPVCQIEELLENMSKYGAYHFLYKRKQPHP